MENEIVTTVFNKDGRIYVCPEKILDYLYETNNKNPYSSLKLNKEGKPYRVVYSTNDGYLALWLTNYIEDSTSLNVYFIGKSEKLADDILLNKDEIYCFEIPMKNGKNANALISHNNKKYFVDTTVSDKDFSFVETYKKDSNNPCFQVDTDKIVKSFPKEIIKELSGYNFANIDFEKLF